MADSAEQKNTPTTSQTPGNTSALVWEFLKVVAISLVAIIVIRFFIFQPFIVSGSSMEPNFQNGQYLVVDEVSYHLGSPQRGDVIVLKYPRDTKEYFIKRVIGLPGEKVEIDNGKVTIFNSQHPEGFSLDETYLPTQGLTYPHDPSIVGGQNILTLGSGQYFMMGDNRLASSDSRDWGILPSNDIVGKVLIRVLPASVFHVYTKPPAYSS